MGKVVINSASQRSAGFGATDRQFSSVVATANGILATEASARRNNLMVNGFRRSVNTSTGAVVVTAATKGATTTLTALNNLEPGDQVQVVSITGMPEISAMKGTVLSATKKQFVLDINSSGFAANGTAGTATVLPTTRTFTVTGITNARKAVVTAENNLKVGELASFSGVVGMTQINGLSGLVLKANSTSFTVDIDTTTTAGNDPNTGGTFANFGVYASGGIVTAFVQDGRVNYSYTGVITAGRTEYGFADRVTNVAPDSLGAGWAQTKPYLLSNSIPYKGATFFKMHSMWPADGVARGSWGYAITSRLHVETTDDMPYFKHASANGYAISVLEDGVAQTLYDSTLGEFDPGEFVGAFGARTDPTKNGFTSFQLDFRQSGGRTKFRRITHHNPIDYSFGFVGLANTSSFRKPSTPPLIAVIGDSISASVTGSNLASYGFAPKLAERLGMELLMASEGGSGYTLVGNAGAGVGYTVPDRIAALKSISQYKDRIKALLLTGGHNDQTSFNANPASVTNALRVSIDAALDGWPSAIIWVAGPLNDAFGTNNADYIAMENAIKGVVASYNSSQVRFVPVMTGEQWITGNGNSVKKNGSGNADFFYELNGGNLDKVHPNALAQSEFADRWHGEIMSSLREIVGA